MDLTAGTYTVCEVLQGGWIQTFPAVTLDGSACHVVLVQSGDVFDVDTAKDFGNFELGAIHGIKFNDTNGNGVQDLGEQGLP